MQISSVFCSETTYTISTEPKRTEHTGGPHRNPHLHQKVTGGSNTPPVPKNLHNRSTLFDSIYPDSYGECLFVVPVREMKSIHFRVLWTFGGQGCFRPVIQLALQLCEVKVYRD